MASELYAMSFTATKGSEVVFSKIQFVADTQSFEEILNRSNTRHSIKLYAVKVSQGPNEPWQEALVDGPLTGVSRWAMPFYKLRLTDFKIKIPHDARTKTVREAFKKTTIQEDWEKTVWYQKIQSQKRRAVMTDFDRYKLMRAKQGRSKILRAEVKKLRAEQKQKAKAAK